jgi:hypothetical protein
MYALIKKNEIVYLVSDFFFNDDNFYFNNYSEMLECLDFKSNLVSSLLEGNDYYLLDFVDLSLEKYTYESKDNRLTFF